MPIRAAQDGGVSSGLAALVPATRPTSRAQAPHWTSTSRQLFYANSGAAYNPDDESNDCAPATDDRHTRHLAKFSRAASRTAPISLLISLSQTALFSSPTNLPMSKAAVDGGPRLHIRAHRPRHLRRGPIPTSIEAGHAENPGRESPVRQTDSGSTLFYVNESQSSLHRLLLLKKKDLSRGQFGFALSVFARANTEIRKTSCWRFTGAAAAEFTEHIGVRTCARRPRRPAAAPSAGGGSASDLGTRSEMAALAHRSTQRPRTATTRRRRRRRRR